MSVQLQGVSEVISDLAEDIKDSKEEKYNDKKDLIRKILIQKGVIVSDIKMKKNDVNRSIVTVYVKDCEESVESTAKKVYLIILHMQKKKIQKKLILIFLHLHLYQVIYIT